MRNRLSRIFFPIFTECVIFFTLEQPIVPTGQKMINNYNRINRNNCNGRKDHPFSDVFLFPDFGDVAVRPASGSAGGVAPVDVHEDEKTLTFHVELPGIPKDAIEVTIKEGNVLSISAEKKDVHFETDKTTGKVVRSERSYGTFSRCFSLPDDLDLDNVASTHADGVLELRFTKIKKLEPATRRIAIA